MNPPLRRLALAAIAALAAGPGCILFYYPGLPQRDGGPSQEVPLPDGGNGYVLPDGGVTSSLVVPNCQVNPHDATVGEIVTFDGSGSKGSPGASVVTWKWTFGDGDSKSGEVSLVQHLYGDAGTYLATLTATDDTGAEGTIDCHPVTITAATTAAADGG